MNPQGTAGSLLAVTGANGFVGSALFRELRARSRLVRPIVRSQSGVASGQEHHVAGLGSDTDWEAALERVACVIHCAARVHVMRESAGDPLAAFRAVNVDGTRRLAEQAAAVGVRRLVYVSSIKVNGEATKPGRPFSAAEAPAPLDAYGVSKWEAEQALGEVSAQTGLEVVIVRPPLVYGPLAKGNFARLVACVRRGIPFPLAAVDNRRSLVGIDNLVDLLIRCAEHPLPGLHTFLVSDGEDLSTPGLIRHLGIATGRPARLFAFPPRVLRAGARVVGCGAEIDRLIGSLQVDISHTRQTLNWQPPVGVAEGLARAAKRAGAAPAFQP